MRERIAYICPRINHLKTLGPVIAEQVRRRLGGTPVVIVPTESLVTGRAKNRELAAWRRLDDLRAQLPAVEIADAGSADRLVDVIRRAGVRAVVHQGVRFAPPELAGVAAATRADGVRWCALGYIQEELLDVLNDGPEVLSAFDVATTLSPAGVDLVVELLEARGVPDGKRARALIPIGFTELDQVAQLDRGEIRRRYGLPADRPVIYLSPASRFGLLTAYRSGLLGWERLFRNRALAALGGARWAARRLAAKYPEPDHFVPYAGALGAVRRFADRHGALVVAKTRTKHRDPGYLARHADRVLPDGAYYPFRTLELMAAADYYVGFPTASAIEAAFVGLTMRHILPFPLEEYEDKRFVPVRRAFYAAPGGLWNTPGLAEAYRSYVRADWEAFEAWSRTGALGPPDPGARRAVVDRVIGFDDCKASGRFLDLVEGALG